MVLTLRGRGIAVRALASPFALCASHLARPRRSAFALTASPLARPSRPLSKRFSEGKIICFTVFAVISRSTQMDQLEDVAQVVFDTLLEQSRLGDFAAVAVALRQTRDAGLDEETRAVGVHLLGEELIVRRPGAAADRPRSSRRPARSRTAETHRGWSGAGSGRRDRCARHPCAPAGLRIFPRRST
jgi:hypothetical protein